MSTEVLVDGRWLEPPEPLERVVLALDMLRPGQTLRLLIHREPVFLYPILWEKGFGHTTRPLEDGCFEVLIEPLAKPA
ncbi:MAG: DUF2249 domain-containing protein [Thiobacillus sp.]|nr:DUF2249 domain-containing protein [Thiobacillus sp.]